MKIVVFNQKGGCGKSTVAQLIATALHGGGKTFKFVDLDPQQSSAHDLERLGVKGDNNGEGVYTVVDTYPRVNAKEIQEHLASADQIVIPSSLSAKDLPVTISTIPYVQSLSKAKIRVLWVMVNKSTVAAKSMDEVNKAVRARGVEVFENYLGLRECYRNDFSVEGWAGLNASARFESKEFLFELLV